MTHARIELFVRPNGIGTIDSRHGGTPPRGRHRRTEAYRHSEQDLVPGTGCRTAGSRGMDVRLCRVLERANMLTV